MTRNTKRPSLDLDTFGCSPAARNLAERINQSGNGVLAKKVGKLLTTYQIGLNELMKTNNPSRTTLIDLWYEWVSGQIDEDMDRYGISSYFTNVLKARMRQASDHGKILEVLRDRDEGFEVIAHELRQMRLREDRQS